MEIFLIIVVLILLVILLSKQQGSSAHLQIEIRNLNFKLDDLNAKIDKKLKELEKLKFSTTESKVAENDVIKAVVKPEIVVEEKNISDEAIPVVDEKSAEVTFDQIEEIYSPKEPPIAVLETTSTNEISEVKETSNVQTEPVLKTEPLVQSVRKIEPFVSKKTWFETFKENNPDLEKFIGENLISKIGILILVLGISFFVKYAIDREWINEPARVGIGILAGSIVMGVAHKLRKNFPAFSSVFVAGAVSIFYLTIGIAFHDYQLFSQTIAFVIMVVITIFSALVSVSYNRKELAILTLIGGFAVPFMVSTGSGNYQVLFTYIAILNVGMIIMSYFKKWSIVTLLAFIFTSIIFGTWFISEFNRHEVPYQGALLFATIMYVIFSIAAVINNVKNQGTFSKMEYFIMLFNTFIYFAIGATVFQNWHTEFKGVFTLMLALYNLVFSLVLYRKFGIKKDAIYFLLGLALTFVTLTIPFQFNGNYITLFWACEAVLLLWISQKSKISTFRIGGIIVQILMVFSLLMDWSQNYIMNSEIVLQTVLNKMFLTGLLSLASFIATYFLLKKETESMQFYFITINPKPYKKVALIAAVVLGYLVGMFEIAYQVTQYYFNDASNVSVMVMYHYVFTSILIFFLFKYHSKVNNVMALILSSANIIFFILVFHRLTYNEISDNFYYQYNDKVAFLLHYIIFACVAYCIYVLFKNRKAEAISAVLESKFMLWIFVFCITFILSNEIMVHALASSVDYVNSVVDANNLITGELVSEYTKSIMYEDELGLIKKRVIKIGFPVLWGILSFVFLLIGMKKQIKQLRIIALALLGLTILKLFIFDINVSGPGRIVAFILLGILILIISFVYQKLNKKEAQESKKNNDEKDI